MNADVWIFAATTVVLPLALAEFGDWCPWLAERIVRWSARRLGPNASGFKAERLCVGSAPGCAA